jgi:uncharacterized protein (TIGR00251 family)
VAHEDGVWVSVSISVRAKRSGIEGVRDGAIMVNVMAPPVECAANASIIEVLKHSLDWPKSAIALRRGHKSRDKQFGCAGLSLEIARQRLAKLLP